MLAVTGQPDWLAMISKALICFPTASRTCSSPVRKTDIAGRIGGDEFTIWFYRTNLLALNAAIEAARAGEQGRGFAVVADEVRNLATRTTNATKEIGEMIKAIQTETKQAIVSMEEGVRGTEKGAAEAAQLETSLNDILEQITGVTMQVSQIATAAEEQTATTSEISNNILQMSEVVQQTARGAQDSSEAASSLAHLADDLKGIVGKFALS